MDRYFDGKVKELVLIGQTADKIEECAHRHGFMNTVKKDTFEDAVNYCYEHAVSVMQCSYHLHVQAGACFLTMRSADVSLRK